MSLSSCHSEPFGRAQDKFREESVPSSTGPRLSQMLRVPALSPSAFTQDKLRRMGLSMTTVDLGLSLCRMAQHFGHIVLLPLFFLSYMDSPCFASGIHHDAERVCGHLSGFVMEPCSFRALMVVARQLLCILTA